MKNNLIDKLKTRTAVCAYALGFLVAIGIIGAAQVSALTYQKNVDVSFTFQPSVNISLSSDSLVINDLTPGQSSDSSIITLTVTSNSAAGYTVSSTAGNSTDYTTTDLKHSTDVSQDADKFISLDPTESVATLASITPGKWGYSFSLDNGTTWINANKTGDVNNTGYSGLPLYTTESPAELISTSTNTTSTIDFKIAAASKTTQAAGEYNNVINFIATANPAPGPEPGPTSCPTPVPGATYMQDINSTNKATILANMTEDTPYYLRDSRDEEAYCVAKLKDGNIWMLDNLRLDPTSVSLTDLQDKTNASNQTLTYFKNGGGSSPYPANGVSDAWTSSSQDSYDLPYVATSYKDTTTTSYGFGSGKIGVYYNYCAASAGSYCYASNTSTGNATEDICPANWRMPTGSSSDEYKALYTVYSSDASSFRNALSTPLSGIFGGGSAHSQGSYGLFWSSTRNDGYNMYLLYVDSDVVGPDGKSTRNYSGSVRCVAQ